MPINPEYRGNRIIGYKWGDSGKLYLISKYGENKAFNLAKRQGKAIQVSKHIMVKEHKRKGRNVKKHQRRLL